MKPRYFNKLEIIDEGTIVKSSPDKFKMQAEYQWYKNSFRFLGQQINNKNIKLEIWKPNVYEYWEKDGIGAYSMEYIHGYTLAYHFLNSTLELEKFKDAIESFYYLLGDLPVMRVNDYTKMCIHSMYEDKTLERLAKTDIDLDKEYIVNNYHVPSIREIISNCRVDLRDSDIKLVHGDFCFANMIYRLSTLTIPSDYVYLIDPRGYLPGNIITTAGDTKYDVAKLAHSIIGRYEQIREFGFGITKYSDHEYSWSCLSTDYHKTIEDTFKSLFDKDKYQYYEIMVHLFLSMIPLHKDAPEKQEKMLVNALRLYLERENKFS